jgi:hypothetical protein
VEIPAVERLARFVVSSDEANVIASVYPIGPCCERLRHFNGVFAVQGVSAVFGGIVGMKCDEPR